jgi:hypothetical protein
MVLLSDKVIIIWCSINQNQRFKEICNSRQNMESMTNYTEEMKIEEDSSDQPSFASFFFLTKID